MIDIASIMEWNEHVPWKESAMVEQDLLICRSLVAIYSDEFLASQLAFRGGTALHKLYLSPQPRYSEDIDLVQIHPGPIKDILFRLGEVLSFMPNKVTKPKRYNNTILFHTESEMSPTIPIRLKVEINCYEHFDVLGLVKRPFLVENSWFTGQADLTTYSFNELLGTKMRALYQRRKGRDLFDLYVGLTEGQYDAEEIIHCYNQYMIFTVENPPTYKQFVNNMEAKLNDTEFLGDTEGLLRPEKTFDPDSAYQLVKEELIDRLQK